MRVRPKTRTIRGDSEEHLSRNAIGSPLSRLRSGRFRRRTLLGSRIMKRAISSSLALFALLTLTVGFSVRSAEAAPFTLTSGSSHSETVSSSGADINQDFEFDL